ncbi:MAG TPA: hypothetical protein VFG89_09550 [Coriobacteriia bacterium]|nr:hypothetical protein [Coriobacteriia bacterium]
MVGLDALVESTTADGAVEAVALIRRRVPIDASLALAMPVLVLISLFWLTINVALESLAPPASISDSTRLGWVSAALAILAAFYLLVSIFRTLPWAPRVVIPAAALGVVTLGLWGYASMLSDMKLASALLFAPVVIAIVLGVIAFRISSHAFDTANPFSMAAISLTWGAAFIAPFALIPLIWWLSGEAGNAGMDVIGLFFAPMLGVVVWWIAMLLAQLVKPMAEVEPLSLKRFGLVAVGSLGGMVVLALVAAGVLRLLA